jgi:hypothetical protein
MTEEIARMIWEWVHQEDESDFRCWALAAPWKQDYLKLADAIVSKVIDSLDDDYMPLPSALARSVDGVKPTELEAEKNADAALREYGWKRAAIEAEKECKQLRHDIQQALKVKVENYDRALEVVEAAKDLRNKIADAGEDERLDRGGQAWRLRRAVKEFNKALTKLDGGSND